MHRPMIWLIVSAFVALSLTGCLGAAEKKGKAKQKADSEVTDEELQRVSAALPEKAPAAPAAPRKLLVFTLTKGFRHGSIPLAARTLELIGKKTGAYETVISEELSLLQPDKLAQFDAFCSDQCTGTVTDDEALKKSLLDFVRGGKGYIGVHAATDVGGWNFPEYHELVGGVFNGHPFRRISVKIDDPQSPLNAAFNNQGFEISDEIYTFKEPYSRDKLRVLLSIDWDNSGITTGGNRADNDYALSWIREFGRGRVFYCAFGHDQQIWWNPAILQHYLAGIQYALGDLAADATPSAQAKLEAVRGPVLK